MACGLIVTSITSPVALLGGIAISVAVNLALLRFTRGRLRTGL
jgi:hypothetical protein